MIADAAPVADVQPKAKIFISYSRKDMAFADRLEAALKARGFEPLIDRTEIYVFEPWWERIQKLIEQCDTVAFVISPDSVSSPVALKEVNYAASLNKRFAPIVSRRVAAGDVPEALQRLHFIFFDDPEKFEASADKLAEALQTDIGWIRRHTEFGDAAHRWAEAGRPPGMLLRSPLFDEAETWLALRPGRAPAPTAETEAFIAQSRKAMLGTRRFRLFVAGSTMLTLLLVIILGAVAWTNQETIGDQVRVWTRFRPYGLSVEQELQLKPGAGFKECADCPEMVVVPSGSFLMGASAAESQAPGYSNETPQHTVTIAKPFAVSKYELTFANWDACVAGYRLTLPGVPRFGNPLGCLAGGELLDGGWGRGRQPVINASWNRVRDYVMWLMQVTGRTYRPLSEAEYEYAMRAGTTTAYPWGDDIHANGQAMADCNGCGSKWDSKQTAPVGSFPANKFGLYDTAGNVWELTEDCVHENYDGAPTNGSAWGDNAGLCASHVLRGGSWNSSPADLRSASRGGIAARLPIDGIGFRVAQTLLAP